MDESARSLCVNVFTTETQTDSDHKSIICVVQIQELAMYGSWSVVWRSFIKDY